MAEVKESLTSSVYTDQTPVIDATYDVRVVDDISYDQPSVQFSSIDEFRSSDSFVRLWNELNELVASGQLHKDNPTLKAFIEQLKSNGVLPVKGEVQVSDILAFHQWFRGLDTDQFSDSMTFLEGLILYQWAQSLDERIVDQVIVFDSINQFNQYAIYCQVVMGDEAVTLNYHEKKPIQYDQSQHSTFGILFHHQWVDAVTLSKVDYEKAHHALELTQDDKHELTNWLKLVFPEGWSGLTDEEIIMRIYEQIMGDDFEYVSDIGDQWDSIAQFLKTKSGDCEEYSHLFYCALSMVFESKESSPDIQVLAGLVGTGVNVYGHSIVEVTLNNQSVVFDLTGSKNTVNSLDELPTLSAYKKQYAFDEMLRYDLNQTQLNVESNALANFSTSSSLEDEMQKQYAAIFGQDNLFESVTLTSGDSIDNYDSLIKKVIGLEMVRLIESKDGRAIGLNVVLPTDLKAFQYINGYRPTGDHDLDDSEIIDINQLLLQSFKFNEPLTRQSFSFLSDEEYSVVFSELKSKGLVTLEFGEYFVSYDFVSNVRYTGDHTVIYNKLIEIGFISSSGIIDVKALSDTKKVQQLREFYSYHGDDFLLTNELMAFLKERSYVYLDVASSSLSEDPFNSALNRFEQLSEELFQGLTSSTTPIYSAPKLNGKQLFSLSEFVIGGYSEGHDNSLFIRINHQKLQQMMSMFFSLQNTISAYMTLAFSISDMVSSIASKLGDDQSTASSTSKQRQKILKAFNTYAGGINESLNNLMDLFDKSVQKTNESRYQTALSQIDFEYANFGKQLGDVFLAKSFSIQKENLKAKLSQDYYKMLRDNRQSMQRAMLDVPNFGPNIMPSMFSHFFIDNNEKYHGLNSMQIWSALYARGIMDEYGMLADGVYFFNLFFLIQQFILGSNSSVLLFRTLRHHQFDLSNCSTGVIFRTRNSRTGFF